MERTKKILRILYNSFKDEFSFIKLDKAYYSDPYWKVRDGMVYLIYNKHKVNFFWTVLPVHHTQIFWKFCYYHKQIIWEIWRNEFSEDSTITATKPGIKPPYIFRCHAPWTFENVKTPKDYTIKDMSYISTLSCHVFVFNLGACALARGFTPLEIRCNWCKASSYFHGSSSWKPCVILLLSSFFPLQLKFIRHSLYLSSLKSLWLSATPPL